MKYSMRDLTSSRGSCKEKILHGVRDLLESKLRCLMLSVQEELAKLGLCILRTS